MRPHNKKSAFTLIELLVVIAIIAILAVVVVLTLNPAEMMRQARDSNRLSDLSTLNSALGTYQAQGGNSLGTPNTVYVSIPDPTLTGSATSTCASLGFPALPPGWTYQCTSPEDYRNANGTGWISANLSSVAQGNILSQLPIDPVNQTSTDLYYTYVTNGSQYQLTAHFESQKYATQEIQSGGVDPTMYTTGTNLSLAPFVGGLVDYLPFTEGSGTIAYDKSGFGYNAVVATGTPTWISSCPADSHCLSFAGNSGLNIAGNASSAFNIFPGSRTFVVWLNLTSGNGYAVEQYFGGANQGNLMINPAYVVATYDSAANQHSCSLQSFVSGTWTQVAVIQTRAPNGGSSLTVYVNGVQTCSVGGYSVTSVPPAMFSLGFRGEVGDGFYTGSMDDVRVYDRALSPAEIMALYNAEK